MSLSFSVSYTAYVEVAMNCDCGSYLVAKINIGEDEPEGLTPVEYEERAQNRAREILEKGMKERGWSEEKCTRCNGVTPREQYGRIEVEEGGD